MFNSAVKVNMILLELCLSLHQDALEFIDIKKRKDVSDWNILIHGVFKFTVSIN